MAKRRGWHLRKLLMFAMSSILMGIPLLACGATEVGDTIRKTYKSDTRSVGNPLMGYAPNAWLTREFREDIHLLYMDITWRELEPEKGQYDIAAIAKKNQLERWRQEGKHIVLRFICDKPGEEEHMDIPDWLYDEIGGAGTFYENSYGKGFSPDYNSELFIKCHAQAISALGEAFGQDTFVSYVQLGSIGHWGEWHVDYASGIDRLPLEEVREQYVEPYLSAFPNAYILMRRPFTIAAEEGFGLYNDMTGNYSSTKEWLQWIEEGGRFTQTQEADAFAPMPDYWKTAPSGGEFTSSLSMKYMLSTKNKQTRNLLRQAHTTFLGPKIASESYSGGYTQMLQNMGYRFYISEARLTEEENGTLLEMVWENLGVAPMYFDWPVEVCVWDEAGGVVETVEVPFALSDLIPGEEITCSAMLETTGIALRGYGGYTIGVGIKDPMTGEYAVRIDMKAERRDGMTILFD